MYCNISNDVVPNKASPICYTYINSINFNFKDSTMGRKFQCQKSRVADLNQGVEIAD